MVKQADVDKIDNFTEKERKYYNLLLQYRDVIAGNMKSHAENALDASNADKRGVTTHMADVGADSSRNEMELQLMTDDGSVLDMINDAIQRLPQSLYTMLFHVAVYSRDSTASARACTLFLELCASHANDGDVTMFFPLSSNYLLVWERLCM